MGKTRNLERMVLGPEHNGMRMTPEEFDAVEDWDECYSYELVEGVVVVSPPPAESERGPNEDLGHLLLNYRDGHPKGSSLDATLPEHLVRTPRSRRRADRVIWAGLGRQPRARDDVPAIVIELVSPGRRSWKRDYVERRDEYFALGSREYWINDRFQRILTVYKRWKGKQTEKVISEKETYQTDLLPGFELPVGRVLAVADRWEES